MWKSHGRSMIIDWLQLNGPAVKQQWNWLLLYYAFNRTTTTFQNEMIQLKAISSQQSSFQNQELIYYGRKTRGTWELPNEVAAFTSGQ